MKTNFTLLFLVSGLFIFISLRTAKFISNQSSQSGFEIVNGSSSTSIITPVNLDSESTPHHQISGESNSSYNRRAVPIVACQSIIVQLDATGNATITENAVDNGSVGIGLLTFDTDITSFDCSDIGTPVEVTLTVTDTNGSASCTALVTVEDSIRPLASCRGGISTVTLDSSGNGSILASAVDNGSSDNCGPVSLSFLGGGPNLSTNIALNKPTNQSSTGFGGVSSRAVDGNTNGNWGAGSVTHTGDNNPLPDGRFWEVDLEGDFDIAMLRIWNRTNCCSDRLDNFRITLYDNGVAVGSQDFTTQPNPSLEITSLTGIADRIRVSQLKNAPLSIAEFQVYANGGPEYTFDCTDVGLQTLTMIATDSAGNTDQCSHTVNVVDNLNPSITCPPDVTINSDDGSCGASGVVLETPVISDNCVLLPPTNDAPTVFPVGTTSVTWTVQDASGNLSQCVQNVSVIDNQDPEIVCPSDIVRVANPGLCSAVVTYPLPVATDCSSYTISQIDSTGLTSGNAFPVGVTTLEYQVLDETNRLATCTFTITILDREDPSMILPDDISADADLGSCSASISVPNVVLDDNCSVGTLSWEMIGATTLTGTGQLGTQVFNIGTTVVRYHLSDLAGNSVSGTMEVKITDNEAPQINAPADISISAGTNCQINSLSLGAPSSSDNCGVASIINDASPPYTVGTTIVTWTITDNAGNSSSDTQLVTVVDDVLPDLVLNTTSISALTSDESDDNCSVSVNVPPVVFGDNCSGSSLTWDMTGATNNGGSGNGQIVSPYTFNVGTTTITYTVTDSAIPANSVSKTLLVSVIDDEVPIISSLSDINVTNDNGICGASVSWVEPMANDNCTITSFTQISGFTNPFVFPIGTTTVTYKVDDAAGNSITESFDVTVTDDEAPTISHPNQFSVLSTTTSSDGLGNCSAAIAVPDAIINDNCSVSELNYTITGATSGSGLNQVGTEIFNVGTSVITYRVSDSNSPALEASVSITVEVIDDENPTFNLPSDITVNSCNTIVNYTVSGNDNCGIASINQIDTSGLTSGDAFPSGTTTLEYEITDINGRSTTDRFDITVIDDVLPIVNCPSDVTLNNDSGRCTADFDFQVVATDDCSASPSLTWVMTGQVTDSGSGQIGLYSFPVGATTVTYTVSDGTNIDTCSTLVRVIDNENPILSCPTPAPVYGTDLDSCTRGLTFSASASDNCDTNPILNYSVEGTSITFPYDFPIGTTVVDVLATAANGQTDNCSFTVIIEDNQSPIIECPMLVPSYSTDPGSCTASLDLPATASDNSCLESPVINYSIGGSAISFPYNFPLGSTEVTATADDGNGQTDTCTYIILVEDNENPVANCVSSLDVTLNSSGSASITAAEIDNLSSDNCGIQSLDLDRFNFNCNDLGANTVTLTVTDNSGNTSSCTTTVNVLDPAAMAGVEITVDNNPICLNEAIEFTATPISGGSFPAYEWFINGVSQGTNNTSFQPFTTINDGDEVYVEMQSSLSSCDTTVRSTSIYMTVYSETPVTAPTDICLGSSGSLTPSSGGTWTSSNPAIASVNNSGEINGISPGTVQFTFTNAIGGCETTTNPVIVNNLPTLITPLTICVGSTDNLSPSSGGTWISNDPAIASVDNSGGVTGISTGFVSFTFVDANGCQNTTDSIEVLEAPIIDTITTTTNPLCAGETVTLQSLVQPSSNPATAVTLVNYNFNLGDDSLGYADYDGQEIPGIISDLTNSTMTYNYGYGGTNTGANAFVADPTTGNENSLRQIDNNGFDDDGEWIFNVRGSVLDDYRDFRIYFQTFRNRPNGNPKYIDISYRADGIGPFIDVLRFDMENNNTSRRWREVLFSLPSGADNASQLEIKLYVNDGRNSNNNRPDIRIDNFQLQGKIGGDLVSYSWTANTGVNAGLPAEASTPSPSNSLIQVNPTVSTNYTLTVQNGSTGCTDTQTVSVAVNPSPELFVTAEYCPEDDPNTARDESEMVELIVSSPSDPNVSYEWQTTPVQTGSSIFVDIADIYTVIGTNPNGCTSVGTVSIAQELVINGDFTDLDIMDDSAYPFQSGHTFVPNQPGLVPANQGELWRDTGLLGYTITERGDDVHRFFRGTDHTQNSEGPQNFMVINGDANIDVWRQDNTPILPNTTYYFSAWVMRCINGNPPTLRFVVNGVQVGIPITPPPRTGPNNVNNNWVRFYGTWTSGPTDTTVDIAIRNLNPVQGGNDYGIDDISFATLSTFIRLETELPTISQTTCENNPIETISYAIGGGLNPPSIEWTRDGTALGTDVFPDGLSRTYNGSTYVINGTPTESGVYEYTIQTTSTCDVKTAEGIINVEEAPVVSISNASVPLCFNDSSILMNGILSGSATSGSWSTSGSGTFTDVSANGTTATYNLGVGETSGLVTLTFTSNDPSGQCEAAVATYDLQITPFVVADAGSVTVGSGCDNTTVSLSANNVLGSWTVTSGQPSGSYFFSNVNAHNATFTGESGENYILQWEAFNTIPCVNTTDTLVVNLPDCGDNIDFDGVDDYISFSDNYDMDSRAFSIEAWIKTDNTSGAKTIISKRDGDALSTGYDLMLINNRLRFRWNSNSGLFSNQPLNNSKWYHIAVTFNGSNRYDLFIDGFNVGSSTSGSDPIANTNRFLIGAMDRTNSSPVQFFGGAIDEVRIWDVALTLTQIQDMMNQELIADGTQVRGAIVPEIVNGLQWSDLRGYYQMRNGSQSTVTNGNIADIGTAVPNSGKLNSMNTVQAETAPIPYISANDTSWDNPNTWTNGDVQQVPNSTLNSINGLPQTWNIVRTQNAVSTARATTLLGLIVDSNELSVVNDQPLTINKYLRIDGKIDLEGESQLLQPIGSRVDAASTGNLERDQQGTSNLYNYNYWASPVSEDGSTFSIDKVLYDGSDPTNPIAVNWTNAFDSNGSTTPVTLSTRWLYTYRNSPENSYPNWTLISQSSPLFVGEGYTMKGSGSSSAEHNYTFIGIPNNGTYLTTISADFQALLGNPYPSAIDGYAFINDNMGVLGSGTLDFWEHAPSNNSHLLSEYEGGYAVLSLSGGVAATTPPSETGGIGNAGKIPGRYIPVGQGFFATASTSGGNVIFQNSQRVFRRESASSVFLRSSTAIAETDNSDIGNDDFTKRIRFDFISPENAIRHLLLAFIDNGEATDGVDFGYDAPNNDSFPSDLSFEIEGGKYVIQGVGTFDETKAYPLILTLGTSGTIQIAFDQFENFEEEIDLYIYDADLNTYTNFNDTNFQITLDAGEYSDRFFLTFQDETVLSVTDNRISDISVNYLQNANEVYIKTPDAVQVKQIYLIGMTGQTVGSWNSTNTPLSNDIRIPVKSVSEGHYILKVETNHHTYNKKVIVKY